jgi:hypothetical protein
MAKGVLGGVLPDPDKGKPHRHTRAKARLMLQDLDRSQAFAALELLIDKRPEEVLDAILDAVGQE